VTGSPAPADFLPPLSLVLGGARSGKSRLAERLVGATGRPRWYLATAEAWDAEMADRIARHRSDRGAGWTTVECPHTLAAALATVPKGAVVLVDCATLWLTNVMLAKEGLPDLAQTGAGLAEAGLPEDGIAAEVATLLAALVACAAPVVVVSNEVGWGIVPENALARRFRDEQGRLNQRLAEQAGLVLGVMAGLPMVLKGALPKGMQ